MEKTTISSREYIVTHEQLLSFRASGDLNLGVHNNQAALMVSSGVGATSTSSKTAFRFWDLAAAIILIGSIVLSFVYYWWLFIVGFITSGILGRANRQTATEDVLSKAFSDRHFYETVAEKDGWLYQVSSSKIAQLKQRDR
jgi:hypothetical protein